MSREALFETGAAAAAFGLAALVTFAPDFGAGLLVPAALALAVGWIVWRDMSDFIIPDGAAFALGALAFAARFATDGLSLETAGHAGLGGLVCGTALFAVREAYFRLRGHDGLGFGDVKLGVAAGVLVGASGFALALLAACLAGLAIAFLRGLRAGSRLDRLPLGALLAPAALAVWAALGPIG